MTGVQMPPREAEQIADALWRIVRPPLLGVLTAALTAEQGSQGNDGLSPETEERHIAESVEKQLARLRAKAAPARRRKSESR